MTGRYWLSSNISGTSLAKKPEIFDGRPKTGDRRLGFLRVAPCRRCIGSLATRMEPEFHDFPVGTKKTWSETTLSKSKKRTTTNY